jgi:predicted DNA binding CopG/RHH family protein
MSPEREKSFRVRVSEEELRMVQELAELDGITASDFIRLFVRKEYAARIGAQKLAKSKPKK